MKNQFSLPYEAGEIHLFMDSLVLYVINKSLQWPDLLRFYVIANMIVENDQT